MAQRPSTQLETVRQTRKRWCQMTAISYHTFNNTDLAVPSVIMWSLDPLMRKGAVLIVQVNNIILAQKRTQHLTALNRNLLRNANHKLWIGKVLLLV